MMPAESNKAAQKRRCVWLLLALLALLHHDFWLWDNRDLLFGFLPVGLGYHAAFTVVAAGLWLAALKWAWPREVEAWAEESEK